MLMLGASSPYRRSLAPFVFAGLGTASSDTGMVRTQTNGWSYGAGLLVPVGSALELFGETRYRMSRYVLPTSSLAPQPRNEIRFGISFRMGGGGSRRSSSAGIGSIIPGWPSENRRPHDDELRIGGARPQHGR
jgi:hypothetical protein